MTTLKMGWHATRLCDRHNGQIVSPVVEWRFAGTGRYAVRYRWVDRSEVTGRQEGEWTEIAGEYWDVQRRLQSESIYTDDHAF